jgi:hypothetical protein
MAPKVNSCRSNFPKTQYASHKNQLHIPFSDILPNLLKYHKETLEFKAFQGAFSWLLKTVGRGIRIRLSQVGQPPAMEDLQSRGLHTGRYGRYSRRSPLRFAGAPAGIPLGFPLGQDWPAVWRIPVPVRISGHHREYRWDFTPDRTNHRYPFSPWSAGGVGGRY